VIIVLTALAIPPARRVSFDYNLLHMQSQGLPAVVYQDKLIQHSTNSVLFAAVVADTLQQATNLIATLTNLPTVAKVESMTEFLTEDQSGKLVVLREIKKVAAEIRFERIDLRPVNITELDSTLYSLHGYCDLAVNSPELEQEPALRQQLLSLKDSLSKLRSLLLLEPEKECSTKLAEFQQALFRDVRDTFETIRNQNDQERLTETDLPAALHNRFIGVNGKYLIQVYPKQDVWNRKAQEEFISDIRSVYKPVTGTPVQLYEYTGLLKKSFEEAAWYSLIAIAILVFVHFRKISAVVLSLLPVGFGSIWMVGLMGLFHVSFNPANVMTLPLIIGIGVTNGIHILNRFAEEHHPSILARSTGKAVLVSGLTAIAGFGSLILAEHRGIRSLGEIMATGVTTCMVVGLTFVPAILNLLNRHGWTIQKTQRDNARSTLGREEPR
jgi:predicted RND superfamily exporter protein